MPRRGGRRRKLASAVNAQLQEEAEPPSNLSSHSRSKHRPSPNRQADDDFRGLAKRVSSKLEDGDYRGVVRIVCSEDAIAELSDDTLSALQRKHPSPHPETVFPSSPNSDGFCPLPRKHPSPYPETVFPSSQNSDGFFPLPRKHPSPYPETVFPSSQNSDGFFPLPRKHPSPYPETVFPSSQNSDGFFPELPSISEDIIAQAISSFPRGSSAGPDGIRPQHLLDLVSPTAERGGKELLHTLAVFANHVLSVTYLWQFSHFLRGYPHSTSEEGGRSTSYCSRPNLASPGC